MSSPGCAETPSGFVGLCRMLPRLDPIRLWRISAQRRLARKALFFREKGAAQERFAVPETGETPKRDAALGHKKAGDP